jgi:hypothetical protein
MDPLLSRELKARETAIQDPRNKGEIQRNILAKLSSKLLNQFANKREARAMETYQMWPSHQQIHFSSSEETKLPKTSKFLFVESHIAFRNFHRLKSRKFQPSTQILA